MMMIIIPPLLRRILILTIMDTGCTSLRLAARIEPRVASLAPREARVDQAAEAREAKVADTMMMMMTAAAGLRAPAPGMEVEAREARPVDVASLAEDAAAMRPPGMADGVDMTDGATMATGPPPALPGLALPPPPGAARVEEAAATAASPEDVARVAEDAAALAGRRLLPAGTPLLITIGADMTDGATTDGPQAAPPSLASLAIVEARVARADGKISIQPSVPCWKSVIDLTPFGKVAIDE